MSIDNAAEMGRIIPASDDEGSEHFGNHALAWMHARGSFVIAPFVGRRAEADEAFIGRTAEAAAALAKEQGLLSRVVSVDGQLRPTTKDYRLNRVNFEIERGKVVRVSRG